MTDRPILMSAPMVRALRGGAKTETRRLATNANARRILAGDRLWVREAFRLESNFDGMPPRMLQATNYTAMPVWFEADRGAPEMSEPGRSLSPWGHPWGKLRPGLHMPRWASRVTLEVETVRREPLHALDEADAHAEGIARSKTGDAAVMAYRLLWDAINGGTPSARWDENPEVIVIRFAVDARPITEIERRAA